MDGLGGARSPLTYNTDTPRTPTPTGSGTRSATVFLERCTSRWSGSISSSRLVFSSSFSPVKRPLLWNQQQVRGLNSSSSSLPLPRPRLAPAEPATSSPPASELLMSTSSCGFRSEAPLQLPGAGGGDHCECRSQPAGRTGPVRRTEKRFRTGVRGSGSPAGTSRNYTDCMNAGRCRTWTGCVFSPDQLDSSAPWALNGSPCAPNTPTGSISKTPAKPLG